MQDSEFRANANFPLGAAIIATESGLADDAVSPYVIYGHPLKPSFSTE